MSSWQIKVLFRWHKIIKKCVDKWILLVVHPVVDYWVDHGVGHGKPIEGEVEVRDVGAEGDRAVVVSVDEVAMVGQPADSEDGNDSDEHSNHLEHPKYMFYIL